MVKLILEKDLKKHVGTGYYDIYYIRMPENTLPRMWIEMLNFIVNKKVKKNIRKIVLKKKYIYKIDKIYFRKNIN